MNVEQALNRIKRQFGDEYGVVITDVDIYAWMYEAEADVIRTTGCNDTTVIFDSDDFPINVPDVVTVKRVAINAKALEYTSLEELDLLNQSRAATGDPRYWYRTARNVSLWPNPTGAVVSVSLTYNKTPTSMSGPAIDNEFTVPEVYHDDIVRYCIGRAHNKNNNLQAEGAQMSMYDKNLNMRRDEAQSSDTPLYKVGDPMDFEGSY